MTLNTIQDHLESSDRIIVITHQHADVDAVGSAMGFATSLESVDIAIPDGVQSEAKRLLDHELVVDSPDIATYDLQIVVDAPSSQRIAPLELATDTPLILVDHHQRGDLADTAVATHIRTEAAASAQLVAEILREGSWTIPEQGAMALAAGILDDTEFKGIVMPDVQKDILSLLKIAGEDSEQLATLWDSAPAWGGRMATAKALVRSRGYKAGEVILLFSEVGGHESDAAQALLDGNADIAVVLSDRGDQVRVVARIREQTDLSLSLPENILQPLAEEFEGHGGGHATAGTAKLNTGNIDAVKEHILQQVEDTTGMQFGEFT